MEKELGPEVIRATQSSLGKYVKRPPLTEKLLKKPPFRFLHDIVTTVLKTTGFFEGLFEPDELISENVKDRENKISFLNKVITVLAFTTGTPLAVKPSKIVAGQEPDKTNELLQCLAQALDKNLSSDEAVKKFKEKSKSSQNTEKMKDQVKAVKKSSDEQKLTSRSTEKLTTKKRDPPDRSLTRNEKDKSNATTKPKQKENSIIKKESPPKKATTKSVVKKNSVERVKATENENKQHKNLNEAVVNETQNVPKSKNNYKDDDDSQISRNEINIINASTIEPQEAKVEQNSQDKLNTSYTITENDLNSSLSSQDLMEVENDKTQENNFEQKSNNIDVNSELKIKSDEATKEPKVLVDSKMIEHEENKDPKPGRSSNTYTDSETSLEKENTQEENTKTGVTRPSSVRPSSSRPGAPRLRERHDNVLTATENLLVGKVNIIVENSPNEEEEESIVLVEQQTNPLLTQDLQEQRPLSSSQQHGHLVQQILESQKEFSQLSGKTEIEWQFGAQKAREALNQEIEQVRFNIQALSRVANPLGKLLDHIQEDVEVMRQELQQWTKTYEENSKELQKQKAATEDSLLPLHTKLKQLDVDMEEKRDKINDLKIVIYKNSTRIKKLLESGNVQ